MAEVFDEDLNNDGETLEINNDVEANDNPDADLEVAETGNDETVEEFEIEIEGEEKEAGGELEKELPDDTPLQKHLRNELKARNKTIKEFELRVAAIEKENQLKQQQQTPPQLQRKPRPKISDDDIAFDEDAHDKALDEWLKHEALVSQQEITIKKQQEEQAKEWNARLANLEATQKEAVRKFGKEKVNAAADKVGRAFTQAQLGVLVDIFEDPALIITALGDSSKLEELAKEKNFVRLAAKLKDFEKGIKMKPRQPETKPERHATGSGGGGGAINQTLATLEAEAERTGDRTKVIQYKRELREKQGK